MRFNFEILASVIIDRGVITHMLVLCEVQGWMIRCSEEKFVLFSEKYEVSFFHGIEHYF
jgi:hypothetical protein